MDVMINNELFKQIYKNTGIPINYDSICGGYQASYAPAINSIFINTQTTAPLHYLLFHELAHATGLPLNREVIITARTDDFRAFQMLGEKRIEEEIIAEGINKMLMYFYNLNDSKSMGFWDRENRRLTMRFHPTEETNYKIREGFNFIINKAWLANIDFNQFKTAA
jgi:hypothetical protein